MADNNMEKKDNMDNIDNTDNTDNADNADNTDNTKNAENEHENEYSLENILGDDGDESEDITEILKRSETLRDPDVISDSVKENDGEQTRERRESEAGELNEAELADLNELDELDDFLDEKPEKDADIDIDPELDNALSDFTDDGKKTDDTTIESEEETKLKKQKKLKLIKRVSLISAICVILIAGGFMAWIQINRYTNSYALTFYDRKISMNDFQYFLLISNDGYSDPVDSAFNQILLYLTIDKAAKERNIDLTDEELAEVKAGSAQMKEQIDMYYPNASKISIGFIEEMIGIEYVYDKLIEKVLDDLGYTFNESDFAVALADYIENGKTDYMQVEFKYIITELRDSAEEAKRLIDSGDLSPEDAIKQYSVAYQVDEAGEEYGFDTLPLNAMLSNGIPSQDVENMIYLEVGETSHVISLTEEMHVLFIPDSVYRPSEAEITENYKPMYEDETKYYMFMGERDKWMTEFEVNMKRNEKALANFDLNALFETPETDYSDYNTEDIY